MSDMYFLVFGIIVCIIGVVMLWAYFKTVILCRQKVTATITSIKEESMLVRGSTVHSYRPSFEYVVDGYSHNGEAPFTTYRENKYNEGDLLEIFVSSSNPELFRFKGRFGLFIAGLVIFAVGGLFVVLYFL